MSHIRVFILAVTTALWALIGNTANACQPEEVSCSVTIPCCAGLTCVPAAPNSYWGFCQSGGGTGGATTTPVPVATVTQAPVATTATVTAVSPASGGVYNGDGTYYEIGVGACGWTNTDSDLVAAVSTTIYGNQANPNTAPICGQCALVTYGGNSVKVTIVDKCMGCQPDDIDMSPAAFSQLADLALGRISVSWTIVAC